MYVQYGCGLTAPKGWLNYDASPRLRLERNAFARRLIRLKYGILFPQNVMYGDITKGLPIKNATVEGVFCSHVLEHLSSCDVDLALQETYRILKPGGIFRLVVPDLYWRALEYVNKAGRNEIDAADRFMRSTLLGKEKRPRGLLGLLRSAFGNSEHLWMFDEAGLTHRLVAVGFTSVRRCSFDDGHNGMFSQVEKVDRYTENSNIELAIEAVKAI